MVDKRARARRLILWRGKEARGKGGHEQLVRLESNLEIARMMQRWLRKWATEHFGGHTGLLLDAVISEEHYGGVWDALVI